MKRAQHPVASTGDRRALYENGGLFTKSLMKGLGEGGGFGQSASSAWN